MNQGTVEPHKENGSCGQFDSPNSRLNQQLVKVDATLSIGHLFSKSV
jgi:hypothetical protein